MLARLAVLAAGLQVALGIDSERVNFGDDDTVCAFPAWINFQIIPETFTLNVELPKNNPEGFQSVGCLFQQTKRDGQYAIVFDDSDGDNVFNTMTEYVFDNGVAAVHETAGFEEKITLKGAQSKRAYESGDAKAYSFKPDDVHLHYTCCASTSDEYAGLDREFAIMSEDPFCCTGVERLGNQNAREPHNTRINKGDGRLKTGNNANGGSP